MTGLGQSEAGPLLGTHVSALELLGRDMAQTNISDLQHKDVFEDSWAYMLLRKSFSTFISHKCGTLLIMKLEGCP